MNGAINTKLRTGGRLIPEQQARKVCAVVSRTPPKLISHHRIRSVARPIPLLMLFALVFAVSVLAADTSPAKRVLMLFSATLLPFK